MDNNITRDEYFTRFNTNMLNLSINGIQLLPYIRTIIHKIEFVLFSNNPDIQIYSIGDLNTSKYGLIVSLKNNQQINNYTIMYDQNILYSTNDPSKIVEEINKYIN